MKNTKGKILEAALSLFNQNGLVNVRLQHIADEAFLSIGNMAYHYKNKEAIVMAIHEQLVAEQKTLMAEMNVVPLFEYVNAYFKKTFELQSKYSFFFTDMLEVFRAYENIAKVHSDLIKWQKQQYRLMVEFNQNRGVFKTFEIEDQVARTVDQLWMSTYMYHTYQLVSGNAASPEHYCEQVWAVFIPLMTDRGIQEFKQFRELSII